MKKLFIIIPGTKSKDPKYLRLLMGPYHRFFGIVAGNKGRHWVKSLKKYLDEHSTATVITFDWPGGLTRHALNKSAKKLAQLIDENRDYDNISLFCMSLGGNLADLALGKLNHTDIIKNIVYVATPHQPTRKTVPSHIRCVNIYSDDDNYVDFANGTLYMGLGRKKLDHGTNIHLPHSRHVDFLTNDPVTYNNKKIRLYALYLDLLNR